MELPEWHEVSDLYDAADVVNLGAVAEMDGAPAYAALRSYATNRRTAAVLGPMPDPIARIANRRLWLKVDIETWLTIPIPQWQRCKSKVQHWINSGRPRQETPAGSVASGDDATLTFANER